MIFPVLESQDRAYLLSDENKHDTTHVIDDLHFPQFCAEQLKVKAESRELGAFMASEINTVMAHFADTQTAADAVERLQASIGQQQWNEPEGLSILAIQMRVAALTRKLYARAGLSDELFVRTLDWFPRFVRWQHANVEGKFGHRVADPDNPALFTEAFWSPRLLNLSILRFGEFEFEFVEPDGEVGEREINLHIPDDARLDAEHMQASFEQFHAFTAAKLAQYADATITCESWLLDPALDELLSAHSHLREFRALFSLQYSEISPDYQKWIAGCEGLSPQELPEATSLQRSIKRYVLAGGQMSVGTGVFNGSVNKSSDTDR